jgi:hypothetical protein
VWYNPNEREIVMENKDIDETRDIDDAQGFQFINGEWIPIFDLKWSIDSTPPEILVPKA